MSDGNESSKPRKDIRTLFGVLVRNCSDNELKAPQDTSLLKSSRRPNMHSDIHASGGSTIALSSSNHTPMPVITQVMAARAAPAQTAAYIRYVEKTAEELYEFVEYDMDEEDLAWLELVNEQRTKANLAPVSQDTFELLLDRFEKESFFQRQSSDNHTTPPAADVDTDDEDAVCAVCLDGDCYSDNVILFCDMCNLAVHQTCYGVPHVPEESWVCRRCLRSPSKSVDCCLCPMKTGAMKQCVGYGDAGMGCAGGGGSQWAHVTCAYWIPEVAFANETFLEPIIGIDRIAPSRWKMACYVCKLRGVGACIQCNFTSCYTGFHVTCAQLAGLYMKTQVVKEGIGEGVVSDKEVLKKIVYCDQHSLSHAGGTTGLAKKQTDDPIGQSLPRLECRPRLRRARKILAENRNISPPLFAPVITVSSIAKITKRACLEQKEAFISRLHCYWTLKRQSRDGAPLLRSLQLRPMIWNSRIHIPKSDAAVKETSAASSTKLSAFCEMGDMQGSVKYIKRIRQELEKVRLLLELIRKREKLKNQKVRVREKQCALELQPLMLVLGRTFKRLQQKEAEINSRAAATALTAGRISEKSGGVNELRTRLSKLGEKLSRYEYMTIDEFCKDFDKLIEDCLRSARASEHDSTGKGEEGGMAVGGGQIYDSLVEFKNQGQVILDQLRSQCASVKYDSPSGMHTDHLNTRDIYEAHRRSFASATAKQKSAMSSVTHSEPGGLRVSNSLGSDHRVGSVSPDIGFGHSVGLDRHSIDSGHSVGSDRHSVGSGQSLKVHCTMDHGSGSIRRGRGRPKKISVDSAETIPGEERHDSRGTDHIDGSTLKESWHIQGTSASHNAEPTKVSSLDSTNTFGVNRRTAVLFGKTASVRRAEKHRNSGLDAEDSDTPKQHRGPGRPPKIAKYPEKPTDKRIPSTEDMPSLERCVEPVGTTSRTDIIAEGQQSRITEKSPEKHSKHRRSDTSLNDSSVAYPPQSVVNEGPATKRISVESPHSAKRISGDVTARRVSGESQHVNKRASGDTPRRVAGDVNQSTSGAQQQQQLPPRKESFLKYRNLGDPDSDVDSQDAGKKLRQEKDTPSSSSSSSEDDDEDNDDDDGGRSSSSGSSDDSRARNTSSASKGGKRTVEAGWSSSDSDGDSEEVTQLVPFDLVWAKCKGYPWYPGLIIDPKMTKFNCLHNGIPVPIPPDDVISLQQKYSLRVYLVLFFDAKRTWQWLPRNKLERLGYDSAVDKSKLSDSKKPNIRKAVQSAYDKALQHKASD